MRDAPAALACLALAACGTASAPASSSGPAESPRLAPHASASSHGPSPAPSAAPTAVACRTSADCPGLGCGPCVPGMVVPSERLAVDCYANPCTQARSVCSPAGQCTVHPLTRAVADVKAEACVRLLRDKWTLCRGRQGDALTACQDAVDEATSRDDEAACARARASLSP